MQVREVQLKAIVVYEHGDSSKMEIAEVQRPTPKSQQVLIETIYASVVVSGGETAIEETRGRTRKPRLRISI